jgi:hypothetical protein
MRWRAFRDRCFRFRVHPVDVPWCQAGHGPCVARPTPIMAALFRPDRQGYCGALLRPRRVGTMRVSCVSQQRLAASISSTKAFSEPCEGYRSRCFLGPRQAMAPGVARIGIAALMAHATSIETEARRSPIALHIVTTPAKRDDRAVRRDCHASNCAHVALRRGERVSTRVHSVIRREKRVPKRGGAANRRVEGASKRVRASLRRVERVSIRVRAAIRLGERVPKRSGDCV